MGDDTRDLWAELQEPFGSEDIELLPRATGKKEERVKRHCDECGGYHDFPCIHLSYVGHAGITMRLNAVDPTWTWEPMGHTESGLPALDTKGGLWAYLTILGVTKPAYGDPGVDWSGKSKAGTPDGMKEAIGDMLRNGAMRFGVGTQLWSKSDRAKNDLMRADEASAQSPDPDAPKADEATLVAIRDLAHTLLGDDFSEGYAAALNARGVAVDTDLTQEQAEAMLATLRLRAGEADDG